ncbi:MAG: fibronectin/fibrinogen-binding protein [Ruminococcaceae bacterium]|nr:fibronectin/fibrinogen-binding protein [Oscillospiraceae bacterium]
MAFDAGFLAAVAAELRQTALGARIEKVYQPERDAVILQMRTFAGGKRLLINAGSANPRMGFTEIPMENPQNPPLFCMLLRKHLSGAKLLSVNQAGFERVLTLEWETRDEMGYTCIRRLVAEMMGKYSNLIFTDGEGRILAVLRPVDFTTSSLRQVLPGMRYELPPPQEKANPLTVAESEFEELLAHAGDRPADKWITATFLGISASVAREIVYRAAGESDALLYSIPKAALYESFAAVISMVREERFSPCVVYDEREVPKEYAFLPLTHYGKMRAVESPSVLLDLWFGEKDKRARITQRAADLLKLLTNARNRIAHKLSLQEAELAACEKGEEYKRAGDLIVANCYQLQKGAKSAVLIDYNDYREDGSFGSVTVELDPRLSPTANAQRYYKRYNKSKSARVELGKQIELGRKELAYLASVNTALSTAETPTDLLEIREELARSGYASRIKTAQSVKRPAAPSFAEYRTTGGYRVLCGKNNLQNEHITHKLAEKNDFWFHVKGMPGSHVVMLLEGKEEPEALDFTEAASIAAIYSEAGGAPMTEVDYTKVRNLKKAPGGKPGFVIYHTNWSATVSPDKEQIAKLRVK